MYRGATEEGISREAVATLECAVLNRQNMLQSLAIPGTYWKMLVYFIVLCTNHIISRFVTELAILLTARKLVPLESYEPLENPKRFDQVRPGKRRVYSVDLYTNFIISRLLQVGSVNDEDVRKKKIVLRGILPALRHVASQQVDAFQKAEASQRPMDARVSIADRPNSWENPQIYPLDPYGNSDFFCKLCHKELSNVYMHCDGCEKLLSRDFNICVDCHEEGRYKTKIQVRSGNDMLLSSYVL